MDDLNNKNNKYSFWTRCKCCNTPLDRRSVDVSKGINESPYCSYCSSAAFDTSDSHDYEHGYLNDLNLFSDSFIDREEEC